MEKPVLTCNHCGNTTPHEIIAYTESALAEYDLEDNYVASIDNYFWLIKCNTCDNVSLVGNWEGGENPKSIHNASPLYPATKHFSDLIPKAVSESYKEAQKVKRISKPAFSVFIRKTLEAILKDKKAGGHYLKEKIRDLANRNIIPGVLADMANAIKYFGDEAAHPNEMELLNSEVDILDDFAIALIEYVYIAPDKLNTLRRSIQAKQIKKIGKK
jgi:hypothetical protein